MEQERRRLILSTIVLVIKDFIEYEYETQYEELQIMRMLMNPRRYVPRIENYMEVVAALNEEDFKAHFRYHLSMLIISLFRTKKTYILHYVCQNRNAYYI